MSFRDRARPHGCMQKDRLPLGAACSRGGRGRCGVALPPEHRPRPSEHTHAKLSDHGQVHLPVSMLGCPVVLLLLGLDLSHRVAVEPVALPPRPAFFPTPHPIFANLSETLPWGSDQAPPLRESWPSGNTETSRPVLRHISHLWVFACFSP